MLLTFYLFIAFDEGGRLLFESGSVLDAMRFHVLGVILDRLAHFDHPTFLKKYLEDHSQCLTCCNLHVLYVEAKPSKCKKHRTLLHS